MTRTAATYDGQPCKHCQGVTRYRSNRNCVVCKAVKSEAAVARRRAAERAHYAAQNEKESRSARQEARCVAILMQLASGPADLHTLRAPLGLHEVSMLRLLRLLRDAKQIYIKRWQRQVGRHASVWALGAKPDAPHLPPLSGAARNTALRARRKADIERHMDYRNRENGQRAVERAAPKRDPLTAALFGQPTQTRK